MHIKHHLDIDPNNPFSNCKLGREKYASILTSIVSTYATGFVLALNNKWGTGKTTFVTMWKHQLESQGYRTLLFNAWETDFEENPLIALIAELKTLIKYGDDEKFKSFISKASVFARNIAPALVKGVAEKYGVADAVTIALEKTTESATEILKDEIDEYAKKKEGIIKFRESLQEFVESVDKKPIVFMIDELDRCRPNYAVALLEQVKHLFSVSGIVFVLSIDKAQLGNAVRGVYGSDLINADEYLRRFIDLEYSIPAPDLQTIVEYYYDYFELDQVLATEHRLKYNDFKHDSYELVTIAVVLFTNANLTLRQLEKIFAHARVALLTLRSNQFMFSSLFILLILLRNCHSNIYERIQQKNYSVDELLNEYSKLLTLDPDLENRNSVVRLEALLAFMYNNFIDMRGLNEKVIKKDSVSNAETLLIKPKVDKSKDFSDFRYYYNEFLSKYDSRSISIKTVMDKIDLIQPVAL